MLKDSVYGRCITINLSKLYSTLKQYNTKAVKLVPKDQRIVATDILAIVKDKNKSSAEMKESIRRLIVDKITDGTKLSEKTKIDVSDCAWLAYRLNREAGRSRIMSWLLASCVLSSAMGMVVFKNNSLDKLTKFIYKTAKYPTWYLLTSWVSKIVMLFLPMLLSLLGIYFGLKLGVPEFIKGINNFVTVQRGVKLNPDIFAYDESWYSTGGWKGSFFKVLTSALPAVQAGMYVWLGIKLCQTFLLLFAAYQAIFLYLNMTRDGKSKVSKLDINPKVSGIASA